MAKLDAIRIAAMLTANSQLDARTCLIPLLDGGLNKLADARLINRGKRVLLDDFQLLVRPEEGTRIVTAHSQASLGQVVRAEAEELRRLRNLVGGERSARNLDHCSYEIVKLHSLFFHHFGSDAVNDLDLQVEFFLEADQRNHNLRSYFNTRLLNIRCRLKHRARLHLGDFRIHDAQAAAAESEHRVEFMQFPDSLFDFFRRNSHLLRQLSLFGAFVRQKLMQRRVEEANRRGAAP